MTTPEPEGGESVSELNEDWRRAHQQKWYAVGCAATLEGLSDDLRKRSGELFAEGDTERAKYLRDILAPEMERRAAEHRDKQTAAKKAMEQYNPVNEDPDDPT